LTKIPVACKTGTAEYGPSAGSGSMKTHAWFTAFAPLPGDKDSGNLSSDSRNQILTGEPEISVTVLIEGAGEGSDKAAPVAKKILEAWFSR
jgi:penicillin-binding protein 2